MIVHVCEQFEHPWGSGGIGGFVEFFVTHVSWICHQKRRLATNFFGKYSKMKIGIFCILGHEGGGRGSERGKKGHEGFLKKCFFKNHIESF